MTIRAIGLGLVSLGLVAFLPAVALAADFRSGDQLTISGTEPLADDLYVSAGMVTVSQPVNGDVFIWGGQVRLEGAVTGDVLVFGGSIDLRAPIGDDLKVGGGNVTVSSSIGGDVLATGGNLEFTKDSSVSGSTWIAAGTLTLAGTTQSVRAAIGSLSVAESATVNGQLRYASEDEAKIATGATITGEVIREAIPATDLNFGSALLLGELYKLIVAFAVGLVLLWLLPHKTQDVVEDWKRSFGKNFLWGFIALFLLPIAAVLLMITLIGIPFGIGIMLLFPILLYLGWIYGALAIGSWLRQVSTRSKTIQPNWWSLLVGLVVFSVIAWIPFVGWLVSFVIFAAGLGSLLRFDLEVFNKLRAEKTL